MRLLFRLLILSCMMIALRADDVQALVEKLYPKNERLKEIRMGDIVRELGAGPGSRVADVGCGPGQFSVILSNVVGRSGKVYCEDINDSGEFGLSTAKKNLKTQHVKNVELIHGSADDPRLPAGLDAVMIVNAYHEMPEFQAMLKHIREALKPGGHLVIVDNTPQRTAKRPRDKQTRNHVLSVELASGEVEAAGFHIVRREDRYIDNPDSESAHWLIAAAKN
jgi:ubiquinone/menaquinone biosynthesis C-methylase UbiE